MFQFLKIIFTALIDFLNVLLKNFYLFLAPSCLLKKDISNQIVFITGAGHGIGRGLAKKLAKEGALILCCDINKDLCEETALEINNEGGKAIAFCADVSKRTDTYEIAERIKKEVGNVNILINNAGIRVGQLFLDTPDYNVQRVLAVNILAHMWTVKAFLPNMIEKNHGHIVTISSLAGLFGINGLVDYCTSKFASVGFHESLYSEMQCLGKSGINFTLVCPYMINTGMFPFSTKLGLSLDVDYGVKKIVEAILINKELLIMPRIFSVLYMFKGVMPINIQFRLAKFFGSDIFIHKDSYK